MARKDRYLAAIDIGSSKTSVLIAEAMPDATPRVVGVGSCPSHGLRKGMIVNLDATVNTLRRAIEEAEMTAGVPVESAVVGLAGAHIKGINSRGGLQLASRAREITRDDIRRAVEAARSITLPPDREVVHVLTQEFLLDGQDGIRDPLGMLGTRLEANVHIVTASATATQNTVTAVNRAGVLVLDTVLEPLASAEACLTADERELGVVVVDIGGGTSELVVFQHGAVRHTGVVPIGGDHFTNDLAVGLRTPIPEAEKIKKQHGAAALAFLPEEDALEVPTVGDRPPRTVTRRMLCDILEPRARELLEQVLDELKRQGLEKSLAAGLVLTGGGARLQGLVELAEVVLEVPTRLGAPRGLEKMTETVSQPEYATLVGLILHAYRLRQLRELQQGSTFGGKLKNLLRGKGWLSRNGGAKHR